jgi:glutathione S-transferase
MTPVTDLSLYHFEGCPYCSLVRAALDRLRLRLELRDIHREPRFRRELEGATGRTTVPCLRIQGEGGSVRWMHESTDIIRYLEDRFGT